VSVRVQGRWFAEATTGRRRAEETPAAMTARAGIRNTGAALERRFRGRVLRLGHQCIQDTCNLEDVPP